MSTVWQTRSRLFLEELEKLAERLSADEARSREVCEERMMRLLAVAVILLRQHRINKQGQCQFCGWTRWKWRFWRRRRRCTVHQALGLAMDQSLDVVWWCVLENIGGKSNLSEVRAWMAKRVANTGATVPAEIVQDSSEDETTIVVENAAGST